MDNAAMMDGTETIGSAGNSLRDMDTPCLVLDIERMDANVARLRERTQRLGVSLRPHLKTSKSVEAARRVMTSPAGPATVSTLKEAMHFANAGVKDLIYAVGISPSKLQQVLELRARGVDIAVVLDSIEQAKAVAAASRQARAAIPALIEIDCDGHRSGVLPTETARLLAIARALDEGAELRGVLTHAGESYAARGIEALRQCAEQERSAVVNAAAILRQSGLRCPVVSVGSTPTAFFAEDLSGVTEMRAGVFVFFDLVMTGIGVCKIEDIAVSVLATVIGHQRDKDWIVIDAGWMAMSQDRGTSKQMVNQGYGVVCDIAGQPYADVIVIGANQEHGIIAVRPGSGGVLPELGLGDRVRILPNHACATAAQHQAYHVVRGAAHRVEEMWPRFGGW